MLGTLPLSNTDTYIYVLQEIENWARAKYEFLD